eukprot:2004096-Prymnesium_polylepis.1
MHRWRKRSRTAVPARACAKASPGHGIPTRPTAQEVPLPPGEVKGWTITDGQPVASADAALQPPACGRPRPPASSSSPTSVVWPARCTARVPDSHTHTPANRPRGAACYSLTPAAQCSSLRTRRSWLTSRRARAIACAVLTERPSPPTPQALASAEPEATLDRSDSVAELLAGIRGEPVPAVRASAAAAPEGCSCGGGPSSAPSAAPLQHLPTPAPAAPAPALAGRKQLTHPSSDAFLAALSEEERAAIRRAQKVWVAAGGDVDPYTVVTMHRFVKGNLGVEKKIDAQISKTVAWRKSSKAAAFRRELLSGKKLCEYDEFMRGILMVSMAPSLGGSHSGLEVAEYM